MRRPYYRKSKTNTTIGSQQSISLADQREQILRILLLGAIIVGTVVLIPRLITDIRSNEWGFAIIYSSGYFVIVFTALLKNLPYKIKADFILILLYILGVSDILTNGIAGNGIIWFIGFVVLSGILFSLRSAILSLSLSIVTLLGIVSLFFGEIIAIPQLASLTSNSSIKDWTSRGMVFLISVLMIVIPQSYIIRNLNNRIENEQTQIDDLDKDRKEFDQRSKELGRRLIQMRTAAEISHSINLVLDPRILLNQVVDIIRERFDLYYVGIFLLDDQEDYAILKAGTGDAGRQMINDGHKLPIGNSSMVGWAIAHHQPRISLDTDDETVLFTNPLLPKTRSEMALPLMSGEQIFGAVSIQSSRQNAFDEDDIAVLQGVVDSLAIALNNAQLFQMEEEHLKEIQNLNRQYLSNAWENIAKNPEISVVDYLNDQIAGSDDDISPINIPIELREQVIGKISLQLGVNTLSSDDLAFVNQITTQAALALENVRLQEETQRRANHDRLVTEIINRARISTDVDTILRTTLSELGKSMQASEGLIHLDIPEVNVSSQHDGSDL